MSPRTRLLAAIATLTVAATTGCEQSPAPTKSTSASTAVLAPPPLDMDPDNPASCKPCHGTVVGEWEESMHSRAHESRDPIFAGMRKLRMKVQGEAIAKKCATCHYPRDAAMTKPAVAKQGMACASCHLVSEIHRDRGPGARKEATGKTRH